MGGEYRDTLIQDKGQHISDEGIVILADAIFNKAAYDNGHAGYTGSLAEKRNDPVEIIRVIVYETREDAEEFIADHNDKWEGATIVPVKNIGWLVGGWCSA